MRVWIVLLAACKAIPPPPVIPMHADTSTEHRDETTVTVVVGLGGTLFGGGGYGTAVRVERQTTDRTTLGVELTVGRGDEGGDLVHWLFAARGYGRFVPDATDHALGIGYGVGLSYLDTGLVTLSGHTGPVFSWANGVVEPLGQLGIAGVVPLRHGRPFGDYSTLEFGGDHTPHVREPHTPRADWFLFADLGVLVPVGDTGNQVSLDLMYGGAIRSDEFYFGVSAADSQR